MNSKILQAYIESATKQDLSGPDHTLNAKCCEAINQKLDLPKEAARILKKRVSSRNPKVQLLALELIDTALGKCGLPFQNAVATPQFMQTLINVLNTREVGHEVSKQILRCIQKWAMHFQKQKDILPAFYEIYVMLRDKGVPFPDENKTIMDSKMTSYPSKPTSSSRGDAGISGGASTRTGGTSRKPTSAKAQAMIGKSESQEMIDNADPRVRKPDQVLVDLITALKAMEDNLVKLIQDANDEFVTNEALLINDNLQQTLFRYQQLKNHQKPKPFKSSFQESKLDSNPAQSAPKQDLPESFIQFSGQTEKKSPGIRVGGRQPPPAQEPAKPAAPKVQNLLDLAEYAMEEKAKPAAPQHDPFSFDNFGAAPANPVQPPVAQPAQPDLFGFGDASPSISQNPPASNQNLFQPAPAMVPAPSQPQPQAQPSAGTGFDPFALNQPGGKKDPKDMTDDEIQQIQNPIQKLNAIMAKKLHLKEQEDKKQQEQLQSVKAGAFNSVSFIQTQMMPGMMGGMGMMGPGMGPGMGMQPGFGASGGMMPMGGAPQPTGFGYNPNMAQPSGTGAPMFPTNSPLDIFNSPGFGGGGMPAGGGSQPFGGMGNPSAMGGSGFPAGGMSGPMGGGMSGSNVGMPSGGGLLNMNGGASTGTSSNVGIGGFDVGMNTGSSAGQGGNDFSDLFGSSANSGGGGSSMVNPSGFPGGMAGGMGGGPPSQPKDDFADLFE